LYTQAGLTGGVSNQGGPLTTIGGNGFVFDSTTAGAQRFAIQRVQRVNNSFGYKTNIAGVAIEARHALTGGNNLDGNANAGNNNFNNGAPVPGQKENGSRQTEVAATYKVGALTIGGGFNIFDQQGQDPTGGTNAKNTIQGVAAYNFGSFTLAGLIAQTKLYGNGANNQDTNDEYLLSATVPLTANSGLFGSYSDAERNNTAAGEELTQAQIAYYYDFSKRTRTYVGFNRLTVENTVGARVEEETDNFTIGLRHNF
jgi:hypothetical protein